MKYNFDKLVDVDKAMSYKNNEIVVLRNRNEILTSNYQKEQDAIVEIDGSIEEIEAEIRELRKKINELNANKNEHRHTINEIEKEQKNNTKTIYIIVRFIKKLANTLKHANRNYVVDMGNNKIKRMKKSSN